jgi:AcrR family transcriptional regulator
VHSICNFHGTRYCRQSSRREHSTAWRFADTRCGRARAESVARTRERIVAAALALTEETRSLDLTLDAVACRAGVGVRTVLRHFGSRDGLFDAVFAAGRAVVEAERQAPAGDVEAALAALLGHYERLGDFTVHLLGQQGTDPRVDLLLSTGRAVHRRSVGEVFAPWLEPLSPVDAEILTDLLVVATDVYSWKLLRRDRGLSASEIERRLRRLIDAVLALSPGGTR